MSLQEMNIDYCDVITCFGALIFVDFKGKIKHKFKWKRL